MTSIENVADLLARQVDASVRRIEFFDAVAAAGTVGQLLASEDGAKWSTDAEDYGPDADLVEPLDLLDTEVLEVVGVWRGSDLASAKLDAVELLMTVGGPTIRATIDRKGWGIVRGHWGSSEVERMTFAGALAEYLFGMLS